MPVFISYPGWASSSWQFCVYIAKGDITGVFRIPILILCLFLILSLRETPETPSCCVGWQASSSQQTSSLTILSAGITGMSCLAWLFTLILCDEWSTSERQLFPLTNDFLSNILLATRSCLQSNSVTFIRAPGQCVLESPLGAIPVILIHSFICDSFLSHFLQLVAVSHSAPTGICTCLRYGCWSLW